MKLREVISVAREALWSSPLRTGLSLLGITIGTAAVIMVGAASRSGKAVIFDELMTFGLRSVWVFKSAGEERPGHVAEEGTGIDLEDIEAVRTECKLIKRVTPVTQRPMWGTTGGHHRRIRLQAVGYEHYLINNDTVKDGRPISWVDVRTGNPVAVLGSDVAQGLFPTTDPIGKSIRVGEGTYRVIGVLEGRSRDFLNSIGITQGGIPNERVLVPITAFYKLTARREVHLLQAEAIDSDTAEKAAEEIISVLNRRHRGKFVYKSEVMQRYIDAANRIISTVSWIGGIAAAISLLVGGIGIMNVLSISVIERTSEIGLRKAVGARRRDIMLQFLIEGVSLCLLGGTIGVVLGSAAIILIQELSGKPRLLAWEYVVTAMLVSLGVGVLAAIYPASRAASQDPINALRYE